MRINSVEQKGYANGIMDWKIFVRQDLVVAKASEFFYEFVGENSFRPVSELLLPEDGELLKKAVEADTFQPLELITVLHNLKDSVRNVYLRNRVNRRRTGFRCIRSPFQIFMIWRTGIYDWSRAF